MKILNCGNCTENQHQYNTFNPCGYSCCTEYSHRDCGFSDEQIKEMFVKKEKEV
jgi:hypothetical protein